MTGFVLQGNILLYSYDTIYNESNYTTFINWAKRLHFILIVHFRHSTNYK